MTKIVGWYAEKIERLRQLPTCHLLLLMTIKFLAGVAVGMLLATWLPIWTWWIFLAVALVAAIPLYAKILGR